MNWFKGVLIGFSLILFGCDNSEHISLSLDKEKESHWVNFCLTDGKNLGWFNDNCELRYKESKIFIDKLYDGTLNNIILLDKRELSNPVFRKISDYALSHEHELKTLNLLKEYNKGKRDYHHTRGQPRIYREIYNNPFIFYFNKNLDDLGDVLYINDEDFICYILKENKIAYCANRLIINYDDNEFLEKDFALYKKLESKLLYEMREKELNLPSIK